MFCGLGFGLQYHIWPTENQNQPAARGVEVSKLPFVTGRSNQDSVLA